ncbi:uncharacterized protein LOC135386949 [Ornithodoros turicata]|uniref:uncharacterized protein LOC135386949 n=1 Tax=Ornithodoros turicata TaxID=34597 RepID=UPI003139F5B4
MNIHQREEELMNVHQQPSEQVPASQMSTRADGSLSCASNEVRSLPQPRPSSAGPSRGVPSFRHSYGGTQHRLEASDSGELMQKIFEAIHALESRIKVFESKTFLHTKEILVQLRDMKKNCHFGRALVELPDECPQLPATTFQRLQEFDDFLGQQGNMTSMMRYFSAKGGTDERDAVRALLRCIVSNDLSMNCSWLGSHGEKHCFSKLENILTLILGCVRINFEGMTDAAVKTTVKKWLYFAADRNGGRSRRRTRKETAE